MGFWRYVEAGLPAAEYQLSPLTDAMIATCETRFGVKFPKSFLDLLRTQNGGLLENSDFKFDGKDCGVSTIFGLDEAAKFNGLKSCASILESWDDMEMRDLFISTAGDPCRILMFADNDYEQYAFDYTHLNEHGEPTVLRLMMGEGDVSSRCVADSFSRFLQCQYSGDSDPAVKMEHANDYELIAEGGYAGHHQVGGTPLAMSWKICAQEDRFIVFAKEDWGLEPHAQLTRAEFKKDALIFQHRLAKWEIEEAGSEFVALIRRAVRRFDVFTNPQGYVLCLEVGPGSGEDVRIQETIPYEGRWKNSTTEVVNTAIYSADQKALEKAFAAMIGWI
jgi:hypothetical protein